jgi:hypothetical protein
MPALIDSPIRRRALTFGAGALLGTALGTAVSPQAEAAATGALAERVKDPAETLKLYMKLNGDAGGKPFVGWFSGHVYSFGQGQLTTPLFGIEGFGQGWTAPNADGSFRSIWKEVGYYKDLKTGEILETWQNPLNGVKCEVMHIHNRSVNADFKPVGQPAAFPNVQIAVGGDLTRQNGADAPFSLPWFVNGDNVSCTLDSRIVGPNPLSPKEWPRESSGERYSVTEFLMHYASLKALLDPKITNVPAVGHWTRICGWLPWMIMGQAPGQCIYRAATKKLARLEDVPPDILDYTRKHYPDFMHLSTPEEQKMPPESSFEVFKATRKPMPA